MVLSGSNNSPIWQVQERLCAPKHSFDDRRPDKNRVVGVTFPVFQERGRQVDLKTFHLAPKGIPLDLNVHQVEQRLVTFGVPGKENRPGTGTPDGVCPGQTGAAARSGQ